MPTDDLTKPAFERTFEHDNWIDGVSLVHAEDVGDKPGFNSRFNAIAQDLTKVEADQLSLYGNDTALLEKLEALEKRLARVEAEALVLAHDVTRPYTATPIFDLLVETSLEPELVTVTWAGADGNVETRIPAWDIFSGKPAITTAVFKVTGTKIWAVRVSTDDRLEDFLPITITAKVFVKAVDYFAAQDAGDVA